MYAVALLATRSAGGVLVQGRVQDRFGQPLSGAHVILSAAGLADTTGDAGLFSLSSTTVATDHRVAQHNGMVRASAEGLVLTGLKGREVRIRLYTLSGRLASRVFEGRVPKNTLLAASWLEQGLASGTYLCRVVLGGRTHTMRVVLAGQESGGERLVVAAAGGGRLGKAREAGELAVSRDGYASAQVGVSTDTAVGLVVTLLRDGVSGAAPVSWQSRRVTLSNTVCDDHSDSYYRWMGGNIKAYNNGCASSSLHEVEYTLITVTNGLIDVDIAPELGLRVLAARDHSVAGGDEVEFFSSTRPTLTNRWLQGAGGVEPSFPFYETGTATVDQEGGYRVMEGADGSVTVAMHMRMDHRQAEMDMGFLGKYGDRPLSAWVTVRPGSSLFEVTYRAENHNPLRRSNRMWSNTFFPGNATDILFPVYWAADHCLADYWVVDGDPSGGRDSDFGLFPQHPFAGMWYASDEVNRLRISDPEQAPGLKLYEGLSSAYYEIWGSTNGVFEIPEGFVDAYEPLQLTHKYYVTRGIGKVAYANEHIAVSLPQAGRFEMVATQAGTVTVSDADGVVLSSQPIGPATAVAGSFAERLAVVLDGDTVFAGELPLVLDRDTTRLDSLRRLSELSWGIGTHDKSELATSEGLRYAPNVEMEALGSKWWTLSAFAAAWFGIVEAQEPSVPVDQVMSVARTLYRLGRLDHARLWAQLANFKQPTPEADYMLGLIAWELGQAVDFGSAGVEADYHRALLALADEDPSGAIDYLRAYTDTHPAAFRPRLLLAYLSRDLSLAAACAMENPGSPEALAVLAELGYGPAEDALTTLVDTATGSDIALADFVSEIQSGTWRHGRRFEYTHASFQSTFPFPQSLKY